MASEEYTLFAPIPTIKAIYIKNNDPWRQLNCDEPHINEKYTPDDFCDRKIVVQFIEKNIPEKSTILPCSIINTMMMDTLLISVRTLSALSWIGTKNTFGTK